MADIGTVKKIAKAKCSDPNWLYARNSKVKSVGNKLGTSRVIKTWKITSLILTEETGELPVHLILAGPGPLREL